MRQTCAPSAVLLPKLLNSFQLSAFSSQHVPEIDCSGFSANKLKTES